MHIQPQSVWHCGCRGARPPPPPILTLSPAAATRCATASPDGPPPTTTTSTTGVSPGGTSGVGGRGTMEVRSVRGRRQTPARQKQQGREREAGGWDLTVGAGRQLRQLDAVQVPHNVLRCRRERVVLRLRGGSGLRGVSDEWGGEAYPKHTLAGLDSPPLSQLNVLPGGPMTRGPPPGGRISRRWSVARRESAAPAGRRRAARSRPRCGPPLVTTFGSNNFCGGLQKRGVAMPAQPGAVDARCTLR